jgi:hypothetical protein
VKKLIDKLARPTEENHADYFRRGVAGGDGEEGQMIALQHHQIRRWRPAPATKATRKSTTKKPARAKQQRKKRLPPKNNRLAPRALAARRRSATHCVFFRPLTATYSGDDAMSLVAGRTVTPSAEDVPDTDDGGEKVTAGEFWPEIALSDAMEMRINGAVTTSRLKQAVIEAVGHTLDQLETGRSNSLPSLATCRQWKLTAEREGSSLPRAVFSIARALIGTFRDVDTTGDAGEARRCAGKQAMICGVMRAGLSDIRGKCAILRRHSDESAGIAGRYRGFAVPASLRHHQGVTRSKCCEQSAGRSDLLEAGQVVELPEISARRQRRPCSYGVNKRIWNGRDVPWSTLLTSVGVMTQKDWLAAIAAVTG